MTILFDGVAYGALLFLIGVGLSVTLGLMNFINLAHGAFAMFGAYVCVVLVGRAGVPFLLAVVLAAIASAALGALLERLLYRRLYGASPLDQVLFSIALVFIAMAAARFLFGAGQQALHLPAYLRGQFNLPGIDIGVYRLFLVVTGLLIAGGLQWAATRTRFGAQLRAAVDNPRMARGVGIDVVRVFGVTFALGCGLAGLGGALGVELLGLDPGFPVKYLVYFLIVVAAGGSGSVGGTLFAAVLLGICDVAGKYYVPQVGAFIIYAIMVLMLIFRPRGLFARGAGR